MTIDGEDSAPMNEYRGRDRVDDIVEFREEDEEELEEDWAVDSRLSRMHCGNQGLLAFSGSVLIAYCPLLPPFPSCRSKSLAHLFSAHSSNNHRGRFRYQSSRLQSSAAAYLCYSTHSYIQMRTCVFQLPSGYFIFWRRTVKISICTKAMLCINCYFFSVCWSLLCCRPTRYESSKERLY